MEKPHYKQPVNGENIATALAFYFNRAGTCYALGGIEQCKRIAEKLSTVTEIESMHEIELLLEENLKYFPDAIKKGVKSRSNYQPSLCQVLDYLLAANYKSWRRLHDAVVAGEIVNYLIKVKSENN